MITYSKENIKRAKFNNGAGKKYKATIRSWDHLYLQGPSSIPACKRSWPLASCIRHSLLKLVWVYHSDVRFSQCCWQFQLWFELPERGEIAIHHVFAYFF
jgi:hypothetical protein